MTDTASNIIPRQPRRMARPQELAVSETTSSSTPETHESDPPTNCALRQVTKKSVVLSLLRREGGARLSEMMSATGWLPHTTRAFLTGLRKRGHAIVRSEAEDGTSFYWLAAVKTEPIAAVSLASVTNDDVRGAG